MDTFIKVFDELVKLAQILAWPLVVFFVARMFRLELSGIMSRLSSLEFNKMKAEFKVEEHIKTAEKALTAVVPALTTENPDQEATESYSGKESIVRDFRVSELSPSASLLESWHGVESAITQIALKHDIKFNPRHHILDLAYQLKTKGVFSQELFDFILQLWNLRSDLLKSPDSTLLDLGAVNRYKEMTNALAKNLQMANQE